MTQESSTNVIEKPKKQLTLKEQVSYSQHVDNRSGKSFLLSLYSMILINSNSVTNPNTFSKTRNKFRNNWYLLYNSVFFSSKLRCLSKSKLSEFFSSKFDKNNGDVVSMFNSKKKIGFGKLTWYWVFRLMYTNRFLFNFKECRNNLTVAKFSFYELALKSYEKNYNNWLFFSNQATEDIDRMFIKKKNRIVYKTYYKHDFRSVLDNNNLKHKPIEDLEVKKDQAQFEAFKVIRRMPTYSQPSVNRSPRFKKKNKIYFTKNLLFSKIWRSRFIRLFKNNSDLVDASAEVHLKKWNPFIFKKNIRIHKNAKYWEKKMKRSLWSLRAARSDYFGAASLSFTRANYLTDKFLHKTKPTILRSFTKSKPSDRRNFINFKYKFPINSAEMALGYDYYNLFPLNAEGLKSYDSNYSNKLSGGVRFFPYKKNLIKYNNVKKSTVVGSFFTFRLLPKKNIDNIDNSQTFVSKNFEIGKESICSKSSLLLNKVKFTDTFCVKRANVHNRRSSFKSNSVGGSAGSYFFKKFKNLVASKAFFLFCYKSKVVVSRFIFKLTSRYFTFRYSLNRLRFDHLLSNIFLNSILSSNSITIASDVIKNRIGSIKQSLLLKLFTKINYLDNKKTVKFSKKLKKLKKSTITSLHRRALASRFFKKKGKRRVILKLKKLFRNNDIFYKSDNSVVVRGRSVKHVNYYSFFKKILRVKKKFKFIDSYKTGFFNNNGLKKNNDSAKFNPKRGFFLKKKISFKKYSLLRSMYSLRYSKNISQLYPYSKRRGVMFEDGLGLEELPWNKTIDSFGEVVYKFNKRRHFNFVRSNGVLHCGEFNYKNFFSKKFFKDSSVFFATDSTFFKDRLHVLKWRSCLVSGRRFSISRPTNSFFSTNLLVSGVSKRISLRANPCSGIVTPVSLNSKKLYYSNGLSVSSKFSFFKLKKTNFSIRRSAFIKKRKFLFKLKPRIKARRRRLFISMPSVRYFKRSKNVEWWLYVNKKTFFRDRKNSVVKKIIHKKLKRRLRSYFIFKKSSLVFLNYYFRKSLVFVNKKSKKFKYSRRTLLHANFIKSLKLTNSGTLKPRWYWSKKKVKHTSLNLFRSRFKLRSKKLKTRLAYCKYRSKSSRSSRLLRAFSFKKYRKEMYSFSWIKSGVLPELLMGGSINSGLLNSYRSRTKKNKYFKSDLCRNYFLNRNTNYRILKQWDFNSKSSDISDIRVPTAQYFFRPKSQYVDRYVKFTKNRNTFYLSRNRRLAFRRNKSMVRTPFSKVSKPCNFNVSGESLISLNFFKNPNYSGIVSDESVLKLSKYSVSESNNSIGNILCFFKKIGIVSNTFFYDLASYKKTFKKTNSTTSQFLGFSSKFSFGNNFLNYFNLDNLGKMLLKNISIYNSLDFSNVFIGSDLVWKDNSVKNFEKSYSAKRRLNRKLFSLNFFFHQRETYLYRKYLLNYKKNLRKLSKSYRSIILKNSITDITLWRTQFMSSGKKTSYFVDPNKVKYNFTNHFAEDRKLAKYSKKNTKMLRDSLRKNLRFVVRKKFKWLNLNKRYFKDTPFANRWSWKSSYTLLKKPIIAFRRDLWSKVNRSLRFRAIDKQSSFIGKRLIKRIRRRIFKRKRLFWTQKRFIIYDATWKNFGYFWAKLSEDYNKYNLEFRKKTFKFPWKRMKPKNYFKKTRAFLWRVKNPLNWRKHGQYAKRFYPRFWYKVFRRKFPLKRHRKDWALKLGKMFAMWQHKKKKYTFYDSSAVYFKNLSINVKPKRNRNYQNYLRKFDMQYVDRDLEIFDFELDPKFGRKSVHFKGPFHTNVKYFADYKKFKKSIPTTASWLFSPNVFSKRLNRVPTDWLNSADDKLFKIYTKRKSRLLRDRFSAYSQFLSILKKKIFNYAKLKKPGYFFKNILETRSVLDKQNDTNIGYLPNSKKYSLVGKNFMYTMSLDRSSLISGFADESLSAFNTLNYKFGIISMNSTVWRYVRKSSNQNYWDNLVYINTSKYRYPEFSTKHSVTKLTYGSNLLALVSLDTKRLNKNFTKPTNLQFCPFKKLDFLETVGKFGVFKFKTKVSGFFKKNLWMFSTLQFAKSNNYTFSV